MVWFIISEFEIVEFSIVEFIIIELFIILDLSKIFDLVIVESFTDESSSIELSIVDPVAVEFSIIILVVFESIIFE